MTSNDQATAVPDRPTRAEIDPVALELVRRCGPEVMAAARRWSDTPEDAEDAYQRGLEIMLTKAPTADPDQLVPWLKTVVKHEAFAIRRQRARHVPSSPFESDLDGQALQTAHGQAEQIDRLRLGAEALRRLKPQEVRAMVLRAEGLSYSEICEETGWTYTKVNRCLAEGRRRFLDRVAGIESGAECERLAPLLSALADGEAGADDLRALRPHLRSCLACRARLREYRAAPRRAAALVPPLAAGPALLGWLRDALAGAHAWAGERSAGLAVRWHQAAELAAANKLAAVAASTAVLAGGGTATVATVAGADRPAAVRPPSGGSVAPSPPSAASGNESAEPRPGDTAASGGGATGGVAPSGETAPADRDPAPPASPARESSGPAPPAGEFTPDPGPAETAATKPERPARADGSQPAGGGEFAP
ncbi:MAG TPA: sigma-70 family RNA polymerase sigma factor [Thermoleophilaceae bacterium]|jgi:RNA polymerase sigma factor (sigma-70 family)